nr:carboxypeptidase M-like [Leptinotarsa decemlineata]
MILHQSIVNTICSCSVNCFLTLNVFLYICLHVSNSLEFRYHKNDEMEEVLRNLSANSGKVRTRVTSIGNSSDTIHPKPLWVMELTASDENRIGVPNVKLLGNMHGNEAGGREVLLHFIEYLIDNYGISKDVTWLLNNTKIHVLPCLNPDGFEVAATTCQGTAGREVPRWDVDLNRHFPDFFEDNSLALSRTDVKESTAIMEWMKKTPFILSAALHGGQLVANYPFDNVRKRSTAKVESLTPDDAEFKHLAKVYSKNHPTMHLGKKNCAGSDLSFADGITNGAKWYTFAGGMGDYNYAFHGCMEVTLEIFCCKYPKPRQLEALWKDNRQSLLMYSMQANMGVTGQIVDFDTGKPIERAELNIVGRDMAFWSSNKTGEFRRILLPGKYQLKVQKTGYHTMIRNFTVAKTIGYPKLTFVTILLYNSSSHTTTTTTTTTTGRTTSTTPQLVISKSTFVPRVLSPRISLEYTEEVPPPMLDLAVRSSSKEDRKHFILIVMVLMMNLFGLR